MRIFRSSIAAISLLVCSPAFADDTSKVAAAEALYVEAEKLEAAGDFEHACPKYAESQQLDPGLGTLLHLAQCFEKAGKHASAWGRFREARELAMRAGDSRAEVAERRAKALEAKLAYLTISIPSQNRVPGMFVTRDGLTVGPGQWNQPIPVDPGEHRVQVGADGHKGFDQSKTVAERSRVNVDVPKLEVIPVTAPVENDPKRGNTQRIVGAAVGGSGLVAAAVGVVFAFTAKSAYSDSEARCPNNQCVDQAALDRRDSAFSQATVATVLIGAGAALAAGGTILYLTAPKSQTTLGVGPTGVMLGGHF